MKSFSGEEEEKIRAFIFTNPHGENGFVYPQPLIAGEELSPLMSAVSRTHISMQDRTLEFLDKVKTDQTRTIIPIINTIVQTFRHPDGTLQISRKTGRFSKEWVLAHGHNSIKEGTSLFGYSENIADITGKKITGHPMNHPQVKSTRYISYRKVLDKVLEDEDILALPNPERYIQYISDMSKKYLEVTSRLTDAVYNHLDNQAVIQILKRPENIEAEVQKRIEREQMLDEEYFPTEKEVEKLRAEVIAGLSEESLRKEMGKFVLDYSRMYLVGGIKTSVVYSADARTLEEIITDLISSPRKEDQKRGQAIWDEAKKIAPVLLGEKSHVKVDKWKVKNENELRSYLEEKYDDLHSEATGIVRTLTPRNIEMYTDRFNAALVVLPYTNASLPGIMKGISESDIKEILAKAHQHRGEHDVLHPAISHGGLMFEITMGYHGYRDMFRHRRGSRSTQLLTTRLGFEIPEIFTIFGMDKEYGKDMEKSREMYELARKTSPHIAEKLVPFGAICRSLHSWQMNQVGYIGKLRSDISKGNVSYVLMAREMINQVSKIMPETAKYFKYDSNIYPMHLWKRGYQ